MNSSDNTKDSSVLVMNLDYGQVNYNPSDETYTGYDNKNQSRFCVTFKQLLETAAYSEEFNEFHANNRRNGIFDLSIMGGGKFPIHSFLSLEISSHFWNQYKAITG